MQKLELLLLKLLLLVIVWIFKIKFAIIELDEAII